jgi:cardiolipin synthase (CMP-forming)
MNIPNTLTLSRIALTPVLIVLLFLDSAQTRWWAFALFAILAFTDYLDGYLARKLNQQSELGALLDPIADKVLVAALIITLVGTGDIANWDIVGAILIISREFLVSGLREFLAQRNLPLPVTNLAKWKTTVQLVAVALFVLPEISITGQSLTTSGLWWLATILTLITGYDYVTSAIDRIRKKNRDS